MKLQLPLVPVAYLLLLLPSILGPQPAHGGEAAVITVLDFQASGISEAEVALFTDFIAAHIVRTGKYTVIDRTQRQVILGEIEFSYANCTDEACQLQIGRLLAATQIIVGSLGKFGARFILNIKLVEVATGRSASAASRVYGSLEELLEDSQGLTLALLGIESDAASPTAPAAASPIAPTAADATRSAAGQKPPLPPAAELPVAMIRLDGDFADWAALSAVFEDPAGDKQGSPPRSGTDIWKVYLARDDRDLYVRFLLADGNLNTSADYKVAILVDGGAEIILQTGYRRNAWRAFIIEWQRDRQQWTDLAAGTVWTRGNSFEAKYRLEDFYRHVPPGRPFTCWALITTQIGGQRQAADLTPRRILRF